MKDIIRKRCFSFKLVKFSSLNDPFTTYTISLSETQKVLVSYCIENNIHLLNIDSTQSFPSKITVYLMCTKKDIYNFIDWLIKTQYKNFCNFSYKKYIF